MLIVLANLFPSGKAGEDFTTIRRYADHALRCRSRTRTPSALPMAAVARRDLVSVPPEGDAEHPGHQDGGRNVEEGDRVHELTLRFPPLV